MKAFSRASSWRPSLASTSSRASCSGRRRWRRCRRRSFCVAAPFAVRPLTPEVVVQAFGVLVLLSVGLSGLGFIVAWQFDSIQGFHAIMNLGLVPLWILSGAAFPADGAAPWVKVLMTANPLTYGVAALRHVLSPTPLPGEPSLGLCLLVVALFGIVTLCLSIVLVRRDSR